ncbi:hypothetical protein [Brochothrix thermosphacta]|uniref:hypothetical protein n=1 Tax=Brochothrix thermosphacta TaxID=2756 RepID=UPI0013C50674|nr:hypothetical protein [Brochothrix thermosphacta]
MMKKAVKLSAALLAGTMVIGAGTPVFAAENGETTINKDGTQTISGGTQASIETKGQLGEIDNKNPGEIIPEGSDKWINVTLPTAVVFNTKADDATVVESPTNYKVTNNSGRGVRVTLTEFVPKGDGHNAALNVLNMKVGSTVVPLIENSKVNGTINTKLADLDAVKGKTTSFTYGFTGKSTGSKDQKIKVAYDMKLKLESIGTNGQVGPGETK